MAFDPYIIDDLKKEYAKAPRGYKGGIVEKYTKILGTSRNSIYRHLNIGRTRKRDKEKARLLEEATRIVWMIKVKGPNDVKPMSTDLALKLAYKTGKMPKCDTCYTVSTINKEAQRLGLNKSETRVQRFQAERPNQLHHIDASTSMYFYVSQRLPNGDCILKLHSPSQNYKNKPTPTPLRVWLYAVVDDYSGYTCVRYTAATGEIGIDNLEFLEWAWSGVGDKLFCGIPEKIKSDKGSLMRGKGTENLLTRLGIEIAQSVPGAKDAHGKVERPWSTHFKRFERPFLAMDEWKNFEIKLSELNRQCSIYLRDEYNQRKHRYENLTREQAWKKIQKSGGVQPLPEGAMRTAFKDTKRKVGKDGCFTLDGKKHEVKGLHSAEVDVLVNVFTGNMKVRDQQTNELYDVIDFTPNPEGTYTAHKETPQQKIKKESESISVTSSLFETGQGIPNVISLPIKKQEERPFDSIFDTAHSDSSKEVFSSVDEAIEEFSNLTGSWPEKNSKNRISLEEIFENQGLRREVIEKYAANYMNYQNQEAQ